MGDSIKVKAKAISTETAETVASGNVRIPATDHLKKLANTHIGSCVAKDEKDTGGDKVNTSTQSFNGGSAYLGVRTKNISSDMAVTLGMKRPYGVFIVEVFRDTSAEKAGIKFGDVIASINGKRVKNGIDFSRKLDALRANKQVELIILRNRQEKKMNVRLGSKPITECDGRKSQFFCVKVIEAKSSKKEVVVAVEVKNIFGGPLFLSTANYLSDATTSLLFDGHSCEVKNIFGLPYFRAGHNSGNVFSYGLYFSENETIVFNHTFNCDGLIPKDNAYLSTDINIGITKEGETLIIRSVISPPSFQISLP